MSINWPELKLLQSPYRHYVLMPSKTPIQWSVSNIAKGRSDPKDLLSWAVRHVIAEIDGGEPTAKAKKAHERALAWAGTFGTLVHDTIEANLTGDPHMPGDRTVDKCLSKEDARKAAVAVASALTWLHNTRLEIVEVERQIAHSITGAKGDPIWYAGTFDLLRRHRDGSYNLVDWKTSGAIRTKHFVQLGGYAEALVTLGVEVKSLTVCRLPRPGGVDVATTTQVQAFRDLFCEELRLHQRYHDAKHHISSCRALEYVANQEQGLNCTSCEAFCRYTTSDDQQTLCVQCNAKQINTESETQK